MSILITGASGAIGKALSKKYTDAKLLYKSSKIDNGIYCDLCIKDSVKSIFQENDFDTIIHCAAISSPKHPEDYENFINQHVLATINLLENCKNNSTFIYLSSYLVFDNYPTLEPKSLYGACKLSCEQICKVYANMKNLKLKIIRPCSVVIKDSTHGLIHDIIKKLKSDSEELELFGSEPGSSRSYCYIDDLIDNIDKHIKQTSPDQILDYLPVIVNFFPNDSINVAQVAHIIMNKLGIVKKIKWLGSSYTGDFNNLDTSKLFLYQAPSVSTNSQGAIERLFNET